MRRGNGALDRKCKCEFRVPIDRLSEIRDEQPVAEMDGRRVFGSCAGAFGRLQDHEAADLWNAGSWLACFDRSNAHAGRVRVLTVCDQFERVHAWGQVRLLVEEDVSRHLVGGACQIIPIAYLSSSVGFVEVYPSR